MDHDRVLFDQLGALTSEQRNPRSRRLDTLTVSGILRLINREDRAVPKAVAKEIPAIARAVSLIVSSLRRGGRLIYVGAGTSGRLGVLDAAECPPTYGTDPEKIRGVIAGGPAAMFRSQEGAEDRREAAARDVRRLRVSERDVVCGVAASMRTPYVVAALGEAKRRGARTILVTTNPRDLLRRKEYAELRTNLDVAICPVVGPEVVTGSTRMKSGTAQKLVLNMMTTAAMVRLGKVYENMMVDLRMNSRKLEERAKRVVMIAAGVDYRTAAEALVEGGGHVKTAIVMLLAGMRASRARRVLLQSGGFVRRAILQSDRSTVRRKRA